MEPPAQTIAAVAVDISRASESHAEDTGLETRTESGNDGDDISTSTYDYTSDEERTLTLGIVYTYASTIVTMNQTVSREYASESSSEASSGDLAAVDPEPDEEAEWLADPEETYQESWSSSSYTGSGSDEATLDKVIYSYWSSYPYHELWAVTSLEATLSGGSESASSSESSEETTQTGNEDDDVSTYTTESSDSSSSTLDIAVVKSGSAYLKTVVTTYDSEYDSSETSDDSWAWADDEDEETIEEAWNNSAESNTTEVRSNSAERNYSFYSGAWHLTYEKEDDEITEEFSATSSGESTKTETGNSEDDISGSSYDQSETGSRTTTSHLEGDGSIATQTIDEYFAREYANSWQDSQFTDDISEPSEDESDRQISTTISSQSQEGSETFEISRVYYRAGGSWTELTLESSYETSEIFEEDSDEESATTYTVVSSPYPSQ